MRIQSADKLVRKETQRRKCDPPKHQVQIPRASIPKSWRNPKKDRAAPQEDYGILEVHKSGPRMESSRGDESHSYDNENHSQRIQKTLASVFRRTLITIPSESRP
jgi:hypothetical protein